mmetsp:Transcript_19493/g.46547  ORF Transcript_19493/g.46547 Transcript_19493/m.46547 type:complete len:212 (-) Transcript_19493:551-1186(-)
MKREVSCLFRLTVNELEGRTRPIHPARAVGMGSPSLARLSNRGITTNVSSSVFAAYSCFCASPNDSTKENHMCCFTVKMSGPSSTSISTMSLAPSASVQTARSVTPDTRKNTRALLPSASEAHVFRIMSRPSRLFPFDSTPMTNVAVHVLSGTQHRILSCRTTVSQFQCCHDSVSFRKPEAWLRKYSSPRSTKAFIPCSTVKLARTMSAGD